MKIIGQMIVWGVLAGATIGWAEEAPFIYNDHGKHDPFLPLVSSAGAIVTYDADLTMNDLVLEGIVADAKGGSNLAIINGKVVKNKDKVGLFVIDIINEDSVELLKDAQRFTLKLKKGGT